MMCDQCKVLELQNGATNKAAIDRALAMRVILRLLNDPPSELADADDFMPAQISGLYDMVNGLLYDLGYTERAQLPRAG